MEQVGNFNRKLQRAREQGFYADATLNLARAEQAQRSTRERLTRLLGLWGAQAQFTLPERLPDLPKSTVDLPDIERLALEQRLDVRGAKLAAEQTAKNLGLTRTTRFVNVLSKSAPSTTPSTKHRPNAAGDRLRAAAVRLGRRARGQGRGDLHAGTPTVPRRRPSNARSGSARGLHRLPLGLRHRIATSATRSCRCASASPRRTCCATTAC